MVNTDQMETEIHQAIAEMKYVRDVRATPNPRNKEQFRIGWEHAAVHGTQYTDHTLHTLTWRNAGYRLGKKFGDQPEYMNAAYAALDGVGTVPAVPNRESSELRSVLQALLQSQ